VRQSGGPGDASNQIRGSREWIDVTASLRKPPVQSVGEGCRVGYGCIKRPTGPKDSCDLGQRSVKILEVFEAMIGYDGIEGRVGKWKQSCVCARSLGRRIKVHSDRKEGESGRVEAASAGAKVQYSGRSRQRVENFLHSSSPSKGHQAAMVTLRGRTGIPNIGHSEELHVQTIQLLCNKLVVWELWQTDCRNKGKTMGMDVVRKDANRRRWTRRIIAILSVLIVVPTVTILLGKLKPAAPVVEASSLWPDTVKRGPMVRNVRGMGTLVAEEILFIPAVTDGRVEKILLRPGALVESDSIIVTLNNSELQQQTLDAEFAVKAAEARYRDLKVQLESQTLTQQAEVARVETDHTQASLRLNRDEALFKEGLIVELNYKLSRSNAEDLGRRVEIERERLKIRKDSVEAQLAVQQAEIDKLKALHGLRREQVGALKVRAGVVGVLQEMPVQEGQRVPAGFIVAKVVQPTRLKAELKIPETQIKDVLIGQLAQVDTRNGIIPGRVSRIDPAAREGTVAVDVKLEGSLPLGARPDLSVDGTIELEKLSDILYVGRPAFGQPNSTVRMFKYDKDGKGANAVQVKFGRTSVNFIEVLEGLVVGDKVILSEMSQWDSHDRVEFN